MSWRWNRPFVAFVLLAALATPPAVAARGGHRDETRFAPSVRIWMVQALDRLWRGLVGVWQEEGVSLDPNGQPKGQTPNPLSDEGISLDPNG